MLAEELFDQRPSPDLHRPVHVVTARTSEAAWPSENSSVARTIHIGDAEPLSAPVEESRPLVLDASSSAFLCQAAGVVAGHEAQSRLTPVLRSLLPKNRRGNLTDFFRCGLSVSCLSVEYNPDVYETSHVRGLVKWWQDPYIVILLCLSFGGLVAMGVWCLVASYKL